MTSKKTQRAIEAATADLNVLLYGKQREIDMHRDNVTYWKAQYGFKLNDATILRKELTKAKARIEDLKATLELARQYVHEDVQNCADGWHESREMRLTIDKALEPNLPKLTVSDYLVTWKSS